MRRRDDAGTSSGGLAYIKEASSSTTLSPSRLAYINRWHARMLPPTTNGADQRHPSQLHQP